MLISLILLYATLAICGIILGIVVVRYDLYRREPWWTLLIALGLGALSIHLAGIAQIAVINLCSSRGVLISDPAFALLAGCTEEIGKLLVVLTIWAVFRKQFDEPVDGLIYGSFAGLGAALEESIAVLTGDGIRGVLPPQEPVRLAGHLIMGGIGGFGVGLLATRHRSGRLAFVAAFLAAILLHTLWDIAAFAAAKYYDAFHALRPVDTVGPIALMLVGMLLYRRMVSVGVRLTSVHLGV